MFNQPVRTVMGRKKLVIASPQTTVRKAAELMARKKIGALMVVERKRLVGIFTERDALFAVIARGRDPETTPDSRCDDDFTPGYRSRKVVRIRTSCHARERLPSPARGQEWRANRNNIRPECFGS
ncbi:MAG: CBS domain-containing protein [Pseudomonadota bacterium]